MRKSIKPNLIRYGVRDFFFCLASLGAIDGLLEVLKDKLPENSELKILFSIISGIEVKIKFFNYLRYAYRFQI